LSTNGKVIGTLVVLLFVVIFWGCSTEKGKLPATDQAKPSVSGADFARVYLDLERIERKYGRVFDSFLKKYNIEGEYRLVADSVFIASNPDLVDEYNKLVAMAKKEKLDVLTKSELTPAKYEDLLRHLSSGNDPLWADSVVAGIKQGQQL